MKMVRGIHFFEETKERLFTICIAGILIPYLKFLTFHREKILNLQENKMKFKNLGWLRETVPVWERSIKLWNGLLGEIVKVIIRNIKIKSDKTLDKPNVGNDSVLVLRRETGRLAGAFLFFILKILPRSKTRMLSFRNKLLNCYSEFLKNKCFTRSEVQFGFYFECIHPETQECPAPALPSIFYTHLAQPHEKKETNEAKFCFTHSWVSTSYSHKKGGRLWLDWRMWLLLKF